MKNSTGKVNLKVRYNVLIAFVYIVGVILLGQLFFLQIVKGKEYRDTSNTRLTRQSTIEAARGNIADRKGKLLATTKTGYSIELYKTKIDNNMLNTTILKMVKLLEDNGDTYVNHFPITADYKYTISKNEVKEWKKQYHISEQASAKDCVYRFREKYEINNTTNMKDVLKIIAIRYEITTKGYSSTKSIQIAEDISKRSAIQFNEQNADFPGITIITQPIRTYTSGSLAAHIIGYIGKISDTEMETKKEEGYTANDYIGRMGVEYSLEKYLRGSNGVRQIDMSVDGTIQNEYVEKEAVAGNDVTLTLDSELQGKTEDIMKDAIKSLRKLGRQSTFGAAVVMNVKSGEVLAMTSYPTYKPEVFIGGISQKDWKDIRDNNKLYSKATQGAYAPGSTFKMVTATAALENDKVTQTERINDRGVYPYAHNPSCWYYKQSHRGHGYLNIKQALQKSCNYFFFEMGRRVGIDVIDKYAEFYGLGEKTGIELSDTAGVLASKEYSKNVKGKSWYLSDTLSAAIGQSYNNFSPLQMAKYVSIIANNGEYVVPTVVKSMKDAEGNDIDKTEIRKHINEYLGVSDKRKTDTKVSRETLNIVKAGMRLVTSPGGTAYSAFADFPKSVAGKTGSAQANIVKGVEKVSGWFVGFTPYKNPEVAVVVLLDDGATDSYAAKAAKKILEAYYKIDTSKKKVKENTKAEAYTER